MAGKIKLEANEFILHEFNRQRYPLNGRQGPKVIKLEVKTRNEGVINKLIDAVVIGLQVEVEFPYLGEIASGIFELRADKLNGKARTLTLESVGDLSISNSPYSGLSPTVTRIIDVHCECDAKDVDVVKLNGIDFFKGQEM